MKWRFRGGAPECRANCTEQDLEYGTGDSNGVVQVRTQGLGVLAAVHSPWVYA